MDPTYIIAAQLGPAGVLPTWHVRCTVCLHLYSSNVSNAVFPSSAPDEPETIEFSEPSRQFSSTEDIAARVAQIRRGSMTTFTVNLGGSTGGQVRGPLFGFGAFIRSSGTDLSPHRAFRAISAHEPVPEERNSFTFT